MRLTNRGWIAVFSVLLGVGIVTGLALPCETEESHNCTWYAGWQGNGAGESFTDVLTIVWHW